MFVFSAAAPKYRALGEIYLFTSCAASPPSLALFRSLAPKPRTQWPIMPRRSLLVEVMASHTTIERRLQQLTNTRALALLDVELPGHAQKTNFFNCVQKHTKRAFLPCLQLLLIVATHRIHRKRTIFTFRHIAHLSTRGHRPTSPTKIRGNLERGWVRGEDRSLRRWTRSSGWSTNANLLILRSCTHSVQKQSTTD